MTKEEFLNLLARRFDGAELTEKMGGWIVTKTGSAVDGLFFSRYAHPEQVECQIDRELKHRSKP